MSLHNANSPNQAQDQSRTRLQVELTPVLVSLLDHISSVTGASRGAIAIQALTDSLPLLVERVDALKRRSGELSKPGKR